ncbi:barstar family protein [Methylorubrum podarium]|jgi:Barstar (barnase inhibitor)|uniref:Barstar family protein n=1 Tax=Methylorubrum podarium TaxID=200476 RepID=A0ABV1QK72_9HYPH|nr:barstar family protein [Methylorubrum podarium]GJE69068.1 hypothetical protein CHKEEEPN_0591 [Methylorubrum podarium]
MTDTLTYAEKDAFCRAGARCLDVGSGLDTKDALIGWYAGALPLPDYWSCNWDAFTDFLEDLSWLPDQAIDIYHDSLPLAGRPEELSIYVNILHTTVRHWRRFPEHDVRVAFHPRWKAAVSGVSLDEL